MELKKHEFAWYFEEYTEQSKTTPDEKVFDALAETVPEARVVQYPGYENDFLNNHYGRFGEVQREVLLLIK